MCPHPNYFGEARTELQTSHKALPFPIFYTSICLNLIDNDFYLNINNTLLVISNNDLYWRCQALIVITYVRHIIQPITHYLVSLAILIRLFYTNRINWDLLNACINTWKKKIYQIDNKQVLEKNENDTEGFYYKNKS